VRPEAPDLELPDVSIDIPFDADPTVKLNDVITEVRRVIALSDIDLLDEANFTSLAEIGHL
jgi:hypothetical protein